MEKKQIWIPVALSVLVTVAYILRRKSALEFPIDPYYIALFGFPILLLVLRRISLSDLGLQIGKPIYGLFFVFLLPGVLFLRFYFTGASFQLSEGIFIILIGSVAEEFFFRGYVQGQFRKFGSIPSIVIASLFFTLVHVVKGYSLLPSLEIFIIGAYFGAARDNNGGNSTIYSMVTHILYNLVVTSMVTL